MAPRRLLRTGIQIATVAVFLLIFIIFLDDRYSVLPENLHTWSPTHHAGLVVVDISTSSCFRITGCKMPAPWVRIEKDLFLGKSWVSHGYVHVERKREEDLTPEDKVVLDVRIGRLDPTTSEAGQEHERWESRPGGIWLRRSSKRHMSDSKGVVTAVDVLFGEDAVDPRPNWAVQDQPLLIDTPASIPLARLSVRRGTPPAMTKPELRIDKNGKFKILQISDLHLATGVGVCRDEVPATPNCEADPKTLEFAGRIIDEEKPDLVVFSGDQVNGETAPDSQSALFKAAELCIRRNVPWASIYGNHDDEGSLSRAQLMLLTESLPLALGEAGPQTADGIGNYYLEVLPHGIGTHSAITLYFLDTHSYSPDEDKYKGYDWIKPSQITWFNEQAKALSQSTSHTAYTHHHLNMAFIHIPLPEQRIPEKVVKGSGTWLEAPTAPWFNTNFKDALIENDISAVSCGHDHANDYCVKDGHSDPSGKTLPKDADQATKNNVERNKVWMCYAGGSGYGGYGGYGGFTRRIRVWEFDMNQGRIDTWKRVDGEEDSRDRITVVDAGKVL